MKRFSVYGLIFPLLLAFSPAAFAGDFGWVQDVNIRARADRSDFQARLEARFKIGDMAVKTVLGNVDQPADAYIVCRLGEMSHQPLDRVMEAYRAEKGRGCRHRAPCIAASAGSIWQVGRTMKN
jgi:hypothetical protein